MSDPVYEDFFGERFVLQPMHESIFFDSHGLPWRVCESDHPEACAFGPLYAARPLTGFNLNEVRERTYESEGWVWLAPQGERIGDGRPEYWVNDTYIP